MTFLVLLLPLPALDAPQWRDRHLAYQNIVVEGPVMLPYIDLALTGVLSCEQRHALRRARGYLRVEKERIAVAQMLRLGKSSLPGWGEFVAICGDSDITRQAYLAMWEKEREPLISFFRGTPDDRFFATGEIIRRDAEGYRWRTHFALRLFERVLEKDLCRDNHYLYIPEKFRELHKRLTNEQKQDTTERDRSD